MINPNIKKQYPVIKMPNGHPVSATMYNRNTSQGVVYTNDEEIINTGLVVNLYATSTVVANINLAHSIRSNLSATADVTDATITKGISLESSISTDNIVSANILVSKLLESNVTSTGTLAADLTVTGSATLLLDLYPDAAAAYSLRKLRTAYTGDAIRVRRSSDNTEQDIGFVSGNLDESALTTFCGAGNGFVTTWYDQSGNARNLIQSTAANQPQLVFSGVINTQNTKPAILLNGTSNSFQMINIGQIINNIGHFNTFGAHKSNSSLIQTIFESIYEINARILSEIGRTTINAYGIGGRRIATDAFKYNISSVTTTNYVLISNIIDYTNSNAFIYQNSNLVATDLNYQTDGLTDSFNTINITFFKRAGQNIAFFNGNSSEFIIYNTNQSLNRAAIETNINTHYAIY
jgi:hypothetical protein